MTGHGHRFGSNEPTPNNDNSAMSTVNPKRSRRRAAHVWLGAGLLAASLAVLGACEGDNLFSGDSSLAMPRASVAGPDFVLAQDTFFIRVDGFAARGVTRIDLALRGAISRDTSVTYAAGTSTSVSQVFAFKAPGFFADTVLVASARVTDKVGSSSPLKSDTVGAFGPPGVISVNKPDSVRAGTTASLRVRVAGGRKITRIDVQVRGAATADRTYTVAPAAYDVTQEIAVDVPAPAADTTLRVTVIPRDEANLTSTNLISVPLAIEPPSAILSAPAQASPGGALNLDVRATAMRLVTSIKIELRGAVNRDTTVKVDPPQADVTKSISLQLPGNISDSTLTVRAFAVDKSGAISGVTTTSNALVRIPLGAPVILSLTSLDSTRGGRVFDVRIMAQGTRPLTRIDVKFRGAVDQDMVFQVNPSRTDVTQDASISIPLDTRDTTLTFTATATDMSGAVSPLMSRTIFVRDVTSPSVQAIINPSQASAGSTVSVRVTANDNVGVRRFGFAAVNSIGDTVGVSPTLANTSGVQRDSTFNWIIPATMTPTRLKIVGIAYDAAGLRATSSAQNLTVVDSTFPTVNIIDPVNNSSFPLTGQVTVRARVQDNSGIRRVTFKGVAVRRDSLSTTTIIDRFIEKVVNFPQAPSTTLPKDTTIVRLLDPVMGITAAEVVSMVVIAEDSVGNIATDTNYVTVGGPSVVLRNPVSGSQVQINGTFQISADASEPTNGLDSMKVYLTGAITDSIVVKNLNGATTRTIDQPYTVGTATGQVNVVARAWNRQGIPGASQTAILTITATAVTDTQAPQLFLNMTSPARVELDDSISVLVRAADIGTSGLARVGIVVIAIPDTTSERQDTIYRDVTFAPSRAGTLDQVFTFRLMDFLEEEVAPGTDQRYGEGSSLRFPRRFTLQAHAFAVDAANNCAAAVSTTTQSLPCMPTSAVPPAPSPNTFKVANTQGQQLALTGALGSSVALPNGGNIADALVDPNPTRPKLYLSNISQNRLEILNLQTRVFESSSNPAFGLVGSAPWGLSFNNNSTIGGPTSKDTLIVANSGGVNLSFLALEGGNALLEDTNRRLNTPNTVLFEITQSVSNGLIRYVKRFYDFSDRPQFIGVTRDNIIVYSTVPTGSAPDGTIRFADTNPDGNVATADTAEVKILFTNGAIRSVPDIYSIANVDSLIVLGGGTSNDLIQIYDHLPGRPRAVITSGAAAVQTAIANIAALGSDILSSPGSWDLDAVGMSDTTFVAVSDDRNWVAFGEGALATASRVMLCCTRNYTPPTPPPPGGLQLGVSGEVAVRDLINNASERVLGLGLNFGGPSGTPGPQFLGVARGSQATYFFTSDLRLQGQFTNGVAAGAGGATLHPDHASITSADPVKTVSFVPTSNATIKIIDTVHFFQTGEIPIRDNIAGPLRAVRPYPADNIVNGSPVPSTDPNYVFVKLVGVTAGGKVVIVNVRRKDVGL